MESTGDQPRQSTPPDETGSDGQTDRPSHQRYETLVQLTELVQETLLDLTTAADREEIEATVCDRLAESSLYRFAGIGTKQPGEQQFDFKAWDTDERGSFVEMAVPAEGPQTCPATKAFETGEITVIDESPPVAFIPLGHDGVVHGVLGVSADSANPFTERKRELFERFGQLIGFAISATQHRRLIESDRRLELTFSMTASETIFTALAGELGCECRLVGTADTCGTETLEYISVSTADPDAVLAVASDSERGEEWRVVRTDEESVVLERRVTDSIPTVLLADGLRLREVATEADSLRIVVEAPLDADIRGVTERLSSYGTVSLVSKRTVDGWRDSSGYLQKTLAEELTDRQQAVLKAAYFGGYFDWPRDSTAEEIASSLGISSATLHQHLRHAQGKLLTAYLDTTSRST